MLEMTFGAIVMLIGIVLGWCMSQASIKKHED
jgi:hypothetical protein